MICTRSKFFHCTLPLLMFLLLFLSPACRRSAEKQSPASKGLSEAAYVGRAQCIRCHEKQYELYAGSDHDLAMAPADSNSVLGDFNDAVFSHLGVVSRFFTRDGRYFVNTEGPEGEMQDFEISYTFGHRPLQQYLIEFPNGGYQCLPLCWDTRPAGEGGQRWFHIYDQERIPPNDVLYWTRVLQNWNFMCAECHSTNLLKNYDNQTRSYHTSWSEIDVSCEACHGPGSLHVTWAEEVEKGGRPDRISDMGLVARLKEKEAATWVFDMETGIARRSKPLESRVVIEVCARCHSRRGLISEEYVTGHSLLQTHRPALLEENLYYPDGQILDEVYVYASFLQSKMYMAGVTCLDCHEPHSTRVYVQGNALCYRCHLPDKYGVRTHHFHKNDSTGALCVECHMPERTYMVVDPRRDHSMRSPRPDLSLRQGTPNACNRCHSDKTTEWAVAYFKEWYGAGPRPEHYGEVFRDARQSQPSRLPGIMELAGNRELPPMVRATALLLLAGYQDGGLAAALQAGLNDPDPLVRFGAVQGTQTLEPAMRNRMLMPLLRDSIRLIRTEASSLIDPDVEPRPDRQQRELIETVTREYIGIQKINGDHPGSHMNLGNYYRRQGDFGTAEDEYKLSILIEPAYTPSYINLADLYREMGREEDGKTVLLQALGTNPEMAEAEYALGLLYVRIKSPDDALYHLGKAVELAPGNARFAYVLAVGYHSYGRSAEAIRLLEKAVGVNPYDRDLLSTLISICADSGERGKALEYARKLEEYYPGDPEIKQMITYLENMPPVN